MCARVDRMLNRELIERLQAEPPDIEVGIGYEGVYETVVELIEIKGIGGVRTLLLEERAYSPTSYPRQD